MIDARLEVFKIVMHHNVGHEVLLLQMFDIIVLTYNENRPQEAELVQWLF